MEKWAACAGTVPDLSGRECVLALDAASHEDLCALAAFFSPRDDEPGYLKTWFWAPGDKIREREMKQLAHYGVWERDGYLNSTPGGRIDHPVIVAAIRELLKQYRVTELLFDPWGADAIINPLQFEVECVEVQQGPKGMADYCKTFLDAIIRQRIVHDDNPVMNWCCANCAAETKPDVVWFSKKTSKEKIDGAIAGAMAVGRGFTKPQEDGPQLIVI
jgi:phage terminase large subunit-like protein